MIGNDEFGRRDITEDVVRGTGAELQHDVLSSFTDAIVAGNDGHARARLACRNDKNAGKRLEIQAVESRHSS